jgi:PST family polysaccharide transporter
MTDVDSNSGRAREEHSMEHLGERAALEHAVVEPGGTEPVVDVDPPLDRNHNLGTTTARGAFVTFGGQGAQILLQMTLVVVLARLLSPKDYGLYAMILVICGVGEVFRDFGLSSAAVQAKTVSKAQRDNLFWINTAIGALLSVLLFAGAPLVARLFDEPRLVPVAHLLCVTFLINGMATQYRADLNRQMRFGPLALTDLTAQVVNLAVGISLAAAGATYWALVTSQIAQVSTVLIMLFIFARWLPGRPQRGANMGGFLHFGSNFVATQLVNYAANNADTLTIGIRFGAVPLGLYNRAYQLLMNPLNQIRKPATTVALPVLSRLQDSPAQANAYIVRGQILIGYTVVAGLAFAAGAAVPLVHLFLGDKWDSVAFIFGMLGIAAIFQMMSFVGYWIYLSKGLTNHLLRWTVMSSVLRVVCILIGSMWGIQGVAVGFAIAPALAWPLSLYWLARRAPIPLRALYTGAGRILAIAAALGASSLAVCRGLSGADDLVQLGAAAAACATVLALVAGVFPVVRSDLASISVVARKLKRR